MSNLPKRRWCYVKNPSHFDIGPCKCGNTNTQWSEYENHLWCENCKIDFIPEDKGIFDGPIGLESANILGYNFNIRSLE